MSLPYFEAPAEDWEPFMRLALDAAKAAGDMEEAPVGAVVAEPGGSIVAVAGNQPICTHDPTAHAEVLALRRAGERLGNYRLTGCVLVCTLEPCLMCLGAAVHARVAGIVFGAEDPKTGALVSRMDGANLDFFNHRLQVRGGVLAEEAAAMLTAFFKVRRKSG